jgi:hypothetical protein
MKSGLTISGLTQHDPAKKTGCSQDADQLAEAFQNKCPQRGTYRGRQFAIRTPAGIGGRRSTPFWI